MTMISKMKCSDTTWLHENDQQVRPGMTDCVRYSVMLFTTFNRRLVHNSLFGLILVQDGFFALGKVRVCFCPQSQKFPQCCVLNNSSVYLIDYGLLSRKIVERFLFSRLSSQDDHWCDVFLTVTVHGCIQRWSSKNRFAFCYRQLIQQFLGRRT